MKRCCRCGALALLMFLLAGCTFDSIVAQQGKASDLWPELTAGRTYGQQFVSTRPDLYRIDLGTATFARTNTASVIFHLRAGPSAESDIAQVTIPGVEIQNERPTSVTFPPLRDSQGQSYYFFVESLEAVPGNAVTVYVSNADVYPDGTAYRDGRAVDGDLVFTAYARESYTLSSILSDFGARAAHDVPFFAVYTFLIVACCAGLVVSLRPRYRD